MVHKNVLYHLIIGIVTHCYALHSVTKKGQGMSGVNLITVTSLRVRVMRY